MFEITLFGISVTFTAANIALALAGLVLGLTVVPWMSHRILLRKYKQLKDWWYDSAEKYEEKLKEDPDYVANPDDPGLDGALGVWVRDVRTSLRRDLLPKERYEKAVELGIVEDDGDSIEAPTLLEADVREKYERPIPKTAIAIAAVSLAVVYSIGIMGDFYGNLSIIPFITLLWILALCDQTSHILPTFLAYAAYVLVIPILIFANGAPGPVSAIGTAAATLGLFLLCNIIFSFLGSPNAVGKGDVRLIPACSMAIGFQLPLLYAAATMAFSMLIVTILTKIFANRNLGLKDTMPMGMYVALGTSVGIVSMVILAI